MRNRRHSIPLIIGLCLIALFAGCNNPADTPIRYTHVNTIHHASAGAIEPFGLAVSGDTLYISDGAAGTVREIKDGNSRILASGLNTPSAIAFLPNGDLVVADTGSHTIRRISADGAVSIIAGVEGTVGSNDGPAASATFNAPVGIAVDGEGMVYVADTYNDRIRTIRNGIVTTIAGERRGFADGVGASALFDTPLGIAIWNDKLLVADSGNARIRVIDKSGIVSTLAGGAEHDLIDGTLGSARFVDPTAITVDKFGTIFVADGNAIRVIGRRMIPLVETLAGDRRGFANGDPVRARFNRPSGLAVGPDRSLYIADSDNRAIRVMSGGPTEDTETREGQVRVDEDQFPLATRWPFDPPDRPREIAGTLGEIRGEIGPENKPVWFHNGLDIAGAYGETTKFIRDETVLDPHSADNFGTSRELLRMPLVGYIHLRLGRDKDDRTFGDPRFQFERDAGGKLIGLRVPRGARFSSGEAIGTLNAMNHVHLIAGRDGHEVNAIAALQLPGIGDSIAPVIEKVGLYSDAWDPISVDSTTPLPDKLRVVVQAYDRMDGNSERRRLGVYRVGYQLVSNGSPVGETEWRISFGRTPSSDAVRLVYAGESRSGYTPDTIFNYIATNRVDGDEAREDFLDTTALAPGTYTLRVFAADYFGNIASKEIDLLK